MNNTNFVLIKKP